MSLVDGFVGEGESERSFYGLQRLVRVDAGEHSGAGPGFSRQYRVSLAPLWSYNIRLWIQRTWSNRRIEGQVGISPISQSTWGSPHSPRTLPRSFKPGRVREVSELAVPNQTPWFAQFGLLGWRPPPHPLETLLQFRGYPQVSLLRLCEVTRHHQYGLYWLAWENVGQFEFRPF